jgi:hypothetical protein
LCSAPCTSCSGLSCISGKRVVCVGGSGMVGDPGLPPQPPWVLGLIAGVCLLGTLLSVWAFALCIPLACNLMLMCFRREGITPAMKRRADAAPTVPFRDPVTWAGTDCTLVLAPIQPPVCFCAHPGSLLAAFRPALFAPARTPRHPAPSALLLSPTARAHSRQPMLCVHHSALGFGGGTVPQYPPQPGLGVGVGQASLLTLDAWPSLYMHAP